jgi:hypothetical protein
MQDLQGNFGNKDANVRQVPVNIAFGESQAAIQCLNCQKLSQAGFFFQFSGQTLLVCIHCTVIGIDKYQKLHPGEKLMQTDIEVNAGELNEAAEAVRDKLPELSESKALEAAKAAIQSL